MALLRGGAGASPSKEEAFQAGAASPPRSDVARRQTAAQVFLLRTRAGARRDPGWGSVARWCSFPAGLNCSPGNWSWRA